MELVKLLEQETGRRSGVVFMTRIMKGSDLLKALAECKVQESIRPMTRRILEENGERIT